MAKFGIGFDPDSASMAFDNFLAQSQAYPCARACGMFVETTEHLKDFCSELFLYANPVVFNCEDMIPI